MTDRNTCKASACGRRGSSNEGLCRTHYKAAWKARQPKTSCTAIGCGNVALARNLCARHYVSDRLVFPLSDRELSAFAALYVVTDADCWQWSGQRTGKGYGLHLGKKAHRVSYQHYTGPVPEGLEIDHLCNNRACVNPQHLEAVTHAENLRRARTRRAASLA